MHRKVKILDLTIKWFFVLVAPLGRKTSAEVERKFETSMHYFAAYFLVVPVMYAYAISFGFNGDECPLSRGCVKAIWETTVLDQMLLDRWGYQGEVFFFHMVVLATLCMATVFLFFFWIVLKQHIKPNPNAQNLLAATLIVGILTVLLYPEVHIDMLLLLIAPLVLVGAILGVDLAILTKKSINLDSAGV